MDAQSLVGLTLVACRFSRGSYAFDLIRAGKDRYRNLLVSTSYNVHFGEGPRVDACADFSQLIWPMLERDITGVHLDPGGTEVRFEFGEIDSFTVWSEGAPSDNLLRVNDLQSGAWSTIP